MSIFTEVAYEELNSRQKENYNFHQVAARLAGYGFNSMRVTDDWQGADFIACHIDGSQFLKVQLKGRLTIDQKYAGKDIHVAFLDGADCYVYPHDDVRDQILALGKIASSRSWTEGGSYAWPYLSNWAKELLTSYKV